MTDGDKRAAQIEYLRLLKDEFRFYWPHGTVRSSEPGERESFDKAKQKIAELERKIEIGLGMRYV
ncbi:hypothetical protein GCM10022239_03570 [Leifsonia bigeumensis]|uniref:Uncharacterized protein n=1 Tax=Leifsonella bigeumensis TaxID=433643 RepID=A0ABP7F3N4_9MICO